MSSALNEKTISRDEFIESNLGLVHSCANRFRGKGVEYEELYAAGCVGLIKAYDAFNTDRGVKFSTYAVPVILGEIKKLFRDGGIIKVTRSLKELSIKVNYTKDALQRKNGTEPSLKEIAAEIGVSVEDVSQAISAATPPMSLTSAFEDDEGQNEFDVPVDSEEENLLNIMGLKYAMSDLTGEEKKILYLRFYKDETQSSTRAILNKTQVQISIQERKIIEKLRKRFME